MGILYHGLFSFYNTEIFPLPHSCTPLPYTRDPRQVKVHFFRCIFWCLNKYLFMKLNLYLSGFFFSTSSLCKSWRWIMQLWLLIFVNAHMSNNKGKVLERDKKLFISSLRTYLKYSLFEAKESILLCNRNK